MILSSSSPGFPLCIGELFTGEDLENMVHGKHLRRHENCSYVSCIVAPFPSFTGFVTLWCQCQDLALPTACLLPGPLYASMAALLVLPHPFWHARGTRHPAEWKPFLHSPLELMGGILHLPVHPACVSCCANLHTRTTLTDAPGYWNLLSVEPELKLTLDFPQMWMLPPHWLTNHSDWITHMFIRTLAGELWILLWEKRSFWKIWSPVRRHGEGLKIPLPGWDGWMKKISQNT